jgi:hypothetical protein
MGAWAENFDESADGLVTPYPPYSATRRDAAELSTTGNIVITGISEAGGENSIAPDMRWWVPFKPSRITMYDWGASSATPKLRVKTEWVPGMALVDTYAVQYARVCEVAVGGGEEDWEEDHVHPFATVLGTTKGIWVVEGTGDDAGKWAVWVDAYAQGTHNSYFTLIIER